MNKAGTCEADASQPPVRKAGGKKKSRRRAPTRIVINHCPDCERKTIEGRNGPVEVSDALFAQARCDSETLDLREGRQRVAQKIPPMTANYVLARDNHRCQVNGCKNMAFIDLHHEGGRAVVGHDPDDVLVLCTTHHRDVHRGHVRIEGRGKDRRFLLRDGTEVGSRSRFPHVGSSTAIPHVGNSTAVPHVGSRKQDHPSTRN